MTARSVPEWRGRRPDTPAPPRVRRRVFDAYGGRCYLTGRMIDPVRDEWELEHIVALCNGGLNVESNLAPALVEPHKEKTRRDVALKAKVARVRNKHLGIRPKQSRPMPGSRASGWKQRLTSRGVVTERRL